MKAPSDRVSADAPADFAAPELELHEALALIAARASTPLGWLAITTRRPSPDEEEVAARRQLLVETLGLRREGLRLRFHQLEEPDEALARLELEGAVLDAPELANLARLAQTVSDLTDDVRSSEQETPALEEALEIPETVESFIRDTRRALLPEGGIADTASPELASVRRRRSGATDRLQRSLQGHIEAARNDGTLQDDFVTQRNNRFVIPIRADSHRATGGIVHGTSASGVTLFVEPMETVGLNNELVQLVDQERAEEHRVLLGLTEQARGHRRGLHRAAEIVSLFDFLAAATSWAMDAGAVPADVAPPGTIVLRRARHPVLDHRLRLEGGAAVPIDIRLADGEKTLIVSGPNTGGKTVALKTVGLSALMFQCGLPVSAEEASLPVFRQVLADIGDHQSIAADLSTFSSHVGALVRMTEDLRHPALVLIDELGTGTDPEEGTALAIALLDHFQECDVRTLITTHHNGLKAYAETTDGVVNAAVEFDEELLQPTYRLIRGAAGRSGGLDIAARLGLSPAIVDRARGLISEQGRITARYVSRLADLAAAAEDDREAARRELESASDSARQASARAHRDQEAHRKQLEGDRLHCQDELDGLLKEVVRHVEARLERQVARKEADRARSEFSRRARRAVAPGDRSPSSKGDTADLRPGDRVRLADGGRDAQVEKVHGDGRLTVVVGSVRWVVAADGVVRLQPSAPRPIAVEVSSGAAPAATELRLIGQRVDEALDNLERALDRALLAGVLEIRVIHGHGEGRLRRAIRERLDAHPLVERHAAGGPREGGDGATIVRLRE